MQHSVKFSQKQWLKTNYLKTKIVRVGKCYPKFNLDLYSNNCMKHINSCSYLEEHVTTNLKFRSLNCAAYLIPTREA